jgi:hypothetical protein
MLMVEKEARRKGESVIVYANANEGERAFQIRELRQGEAEL